MEPREDQDHVRRELESNEHAVTNVAKVDASTMSSKLDPTLISVSAQKSATCCSSGLPCAGGCPKATGVTMPRSESDDNLSRVFEIWQEMSGLPEELQRFSRCFAGKCVSGCSKSRNTVTIKPDVTQSAEFGKPGKDKIKFPTLERGIARTVPNDDPSITEPVVGFMSPLTKEETPIEDLSEKPPVDVACSKCAAKTCKATCPNKMKIYDVIWPISSVPDESLIEKDSVVENEGRTEDADQSKGLDVSPIPTAPEENIFEKDSVVENERRTEDAVSHPTRILDVSPIPTAPDENLLEKDSVVENKRSTDAAPIRSIDVIPPPVDKKASDKVAKVVKENLANRLPVDDIAEPQKSSAGPSVVVPNAKIKKQIRSLNKTDNLRPQLKTKVAAEPKASCCASAKGGGRGCANCTSCGVGGQCSSNCPNMKSSVLGDLIDYAKDKYTSFIKNFFNYETEVKKGCSHCSSGKCGARCPNYRGRSDQTVKEGVPLNISDAVTAAIPKLKTISQANKKNHLTNMKSNIESKPSPVQKEFSLRLSEDMSKEPDRQNVSFHEDKTRDNPNPEQKDISLRPSADMSKEPEQLNVSHHEDKIRDDPIPEQKDISLRPSADMSKEPELLNVSHHEDKIKDDPILEQKDISLRLSADMSKEPEQLNVSLHEDKIRDDPNPEQKDISLILSEDMSKEPQQLNVSFHEDNIRNDPNVDVKQSEPKISEDRSKRSIRSNVSFVVDEVTDVDATRDDAYVEGDTEDLENLKTELDSDIKTIKHCTKCTKGKCTEKCPNYKEEYTSIFEFSFSDIWNDSIATFSTTSGPVMTSEAISSVSKAEPSEAPNDISLVASRGSMPSENDLSITRSRHTDASEAEHRSLSQIEDDFLKLVGSEFSECRRDNEDNGEEVAPYVPTDIVSKLVEECIKQDQLNSKTPTTRTSSRGKLEDDFMKLVETKLSECKIDVRVDDKRVVEEIPCVPIPNCTVESEDDKSFRQSRPVSQTASNRYSSVAVSRITIERDGQTPQKRNLSEATSRATALSDGICSIVPQEDITKQSQPISQTTLDINSSVAVSRITIECDGQTPQKRNLSEATSRVTAVSDGICSIVPQEDIAKQSQPVSQTALDINSSVAVSRITIECDGQTPQKRNLSEATSRATAVSDGICSIIPQEDIAKQSQPVSQTALDRNSFVAVSRITIECDGQIPQKRNLSEATSRVTAVSDGICSTVPQEDIAKQSQPVSQTALDRNSSVAVSRTPQKGNLSEATSRVTAVSDGICSIVSQEDIVKQSQPVSQTALDRNSSVAVSRITIECDGQTPQKRNLSEATSRATAVSDGICYIVPQEDIVKQSQPVSQTALDRNYSVAVSRITIECDGQTPQKGNLSEATSRATAVSDGICIIVPQEDTAKQSQPVSLTVSRKDTSVTGSRISTVCDDKSSEKKNVSESTSRSDGICSIAFQEQEYVKQSQPVSETQSKNNTFVTFSRITSVCEGELASKGNLSESTSRVTVRSDGLRSTKFQEEELNKQSQPVSQTASKKNTSVTISRISTICDDGMSQEKNISESTSRVTAGSDRICSTITQEELNKKSQPVSKTASKKNTSVTGSSNTAVCDDQISQKINLSESVSRVTTRSDGICSTIAQELSKQSQPASKTASKKNTSVTGSRISTWCDDQMAQETNLSESTSRVTTRSDGICSSVTQEDVGKQSQPISKTASKKSASITGTKIITACDDQISQNVNLSECASRVTSRSDGIRSIITQEELAVQSQPVYKIASKKNTSVTGSRISAWCDDQMAQETNLSESTSRVTTRSDGICSSVTQEDVGKQSQPISKTASKKNASITGSRITTACDDQISQNRNLSKCASRVTSRSDGIRSIITQEELSKQSQPVSKIASKKNTSVTGSRISTWCDDPMAQETNLSESTSRVTTRSDAICSSINEEDVGKERRTISQTVSKKNTSGNVSRITTVCDADDEQMTQNSNLCKSTSRATTRSDSRIEDDCIKLFGTEFSECKMDNHDDNGSMAGEVPCVPIPCYAGEIEGDENDRKSLPGSCTASKKNTSVNASRITTPCDGQTPQRRNLSESTSRVTSVSGGVVCDEQPAPKRSVSEATSRVTTISDGARITTTQEQEQSSGTPRETSVSKSSSCFTNIKNPF